MTKPKTILLSEHRAVFAANDRYWRGIIRSWIREGREWNSTEQKLRARIAKLEGKR